MRILLSLIIIGFDRNCMLIFCSSDSAIELTPLSRDEVDLLEHPKNHTGQRSYKVPS